MRNKYEAQLASLEAKRVKAMLAEGARVTKQYENQLDARNNEIIEYMTKIENMEKTIKL